MSPWKNFIVECKPAVSSVFNSYIICLSKTSNSRYKYSNECAQRLHYHLLWQSGFLFNFYVKKNKNSVYSSTENALSPPSPEGFGLDIKKYISMH